MLYYIYSKGAADMFDDVTYTVTDRASHAILPQIEHMVVLMMENRSLDNLLGWIYDEATTPTKFLPTGSTPCYNGLNTGDYANLHPHVNGGRLSYL